MKPQSSERRRRGLGVVVILAVAALAVFAQTDTLDTIEDIVGVPSKVAMNQGRRNAQRSRNLYASRSGQRRQLAERHRRQNHTQLARLPRQRPRIIRPAGGTKRPRPRPAAPSSGRRPAPPNVVPPPPIIETTAQNLVLTFVTPNQRPVTGLRVAATVHAEGQPDRTLRDLTTDSRGRIRLTQIEPLPVSVDLALEREEDRLAGDRPAGDRPAGDRIAAEADDTEWQFADYRSASILIPNARGARVAAVTPAAASYQVAAAGALVSAPARSAPGAAVRRTIVYEHQQDPIVVERSVVDLDIVGAPPGARVTSEALQGSVPPVPDSGRLTCRLRVSALLEEPVAIRVAADLPAGEAETVIQSYPHDPYTDNAVRCPDLQLVRLSRLEVATGLSVLAERSEVVQRFGDPGRSRDARIQRLPDGSEWWEYPKRGLQLKMRRTPFGQGRDPRTVVERIRIVGPGGGSVAGVTAGSNAAETKRSLGAPQQSGQAPDAGAATVDSYLDRGLRVCHDGATVRWVELARPSRLLAGGTTAFVERPQARLYVEDFTGHARTNLTDLADLKRYLGQVPSVRWANAKDEADLVLSAGVSEFSEQKGQVIAAVPFRYACNTKIRYSLFDAQKNQYVVRDKEVSAGAKADYAVEAGIGAAALTILATRKGDVPKIVAGLLGIAGIADLQRSVKRAADRCPGISARAVFNTMVGDINRAADFSVRVTDIDYQRGTLRLNVGTRAGVEVSRPNAPSEFEVLINGVPLPNQESGPSADYYTAVVVDAGPDSSLCELRHAKRRVNKAQEHFEEKPDPNMIRQIPDPVTAVVSARAWVRFPSIPVLPDIPAEPEPQDAPETPAREEESGSDSLLDRIFGRKKR